jgi:CBS domain-containing protein
MKIDAVLRKKGNSVRTIQPWYTVRTALDRLTSTPTVGALVVTGVEHGFTGLLSERNIISGLNRYGADLLDMQVSRIMSRYVPVCAPFDNITYAMVEMTRSKHRHLPVMDNGELVGIVSIGDLVRARLDEMQLETGVLRDLYLATR